MDQILEFNPEALTICRESRGLSQREFSKEIGVSQALLSQYEQGMKTPNEEKLELISNALRYKKEIFFEQGLHICVPISDPEISKTHRSDLNA